MPPDTGTADCSKNVRRTCNRNRARRSRPVPAQQEVQSLVAHSTRLDDHTAAWRHNRGRLGARHAERGHRVLFLRGKCDHTLLAASSSRLLEASSIRSSARTGTRIRRPILIVGISPLRAASYEVPRHKPKYLLPASGTEIVFSASSVIARLSACQRWPNLTRSQFNM